MKVHAFGAWLVCAAGCGGFEPLDATALSEDELSFAFTSAAGARRGEAAARCVARYPAEAPFDVGDVHVPSVDPESEEAAIPAPLPSLEPIVEQCIEDNGLDCDPAHFISKDAAVCIGEGLAPPGVQAWSAALEFALTHAGRRVYWFVLGFGELDPSGCGPMWTFSIDGVSGQLLFDLGIREFCRIFW